MNMPLFTNLPEAKTRQKGTQLFVLATFQTKRDAQGPEQRITVGTAVAGGPPHRSVREELPHTAPALSRARNRSLGYG